MSEPSIDLKTNSSCNLEKLNHCYIADRPANYWFELGWTVLLPRVSLLRREVGNVDRTILCNCMPSVQVEKKKKENVRYFARLLTSRNFSHFLSAIFYLPPTARNKIDIPRFVGHVWITVLLCARVRFQSFLKSREYSEGIPPALRVCARESVRGELRR